MIGGETVVAMLPPLSESLPPGPPAMDALAAVLPP
jgi:hypothetical protein